MVCKKKRQKRHNDEDDDDVQKNSKETLRKNLFCSSLCINSLNVMSISHKCF